MKITIGGISMNSVRSGWHGGRSGDLEAQAAKPKESSTAQSGTSVWDILVTVILILIILG